MGVGDAWGLEWKLEVRAGSLASPEGCDREGAALSDPWLWSLVSGDTEQWALPIGAAWADEG